MSGEQIAQAKRMRSVNSAANVAQKPESAPQVQADAKQDVMVLLQSADSGEQQFQ